jgi:hypothetical protein
LGFFASPRHAVTADSFRWQWSGATIQKSCGVESGSTWQPILARACGASTLPRPFVCSSQLLPENARYEAFRSAGDTTIGRELITQGRLLATMLAGIANFERGLIRERTGASRKRAAIWTRFSTGLDRDNL